MFPIVFNVTITGDGFTNKRALAKHLKLGYQAMLYTWLQRFYERHFEASAFSRYPAVYKRRRVSKSESRRESERPELARRRPNIRTGEMFQRLRDSARVRGTAKGATLTMLGPWYTDLFGVGNQPDKAREITTVSGVEQAELRRVFRDFLVRGINGDRTVRRIRIGAV